MHQGILSRHQAKSVQRFIHQALSVMVIVALSLPPDTGLAASSIQQPVDTPTPTATLDVTALPEATLTLAATDTPDAQKATATNTLEAVSSETPTPTGVVKATETSTQIPATPDASVPAATSLPDAPLPPPDSLTLDFAADPGQAKPGTVVTFNVTITNNTKTDVTNAVFVNTLPNEFESTDAGFPGFNYDPQTRQLTWNLADQKENVIPTGSKVALTYTIRVSDKATESKIADTAVLKADGLAEPLMAEAGLIISNRDQDMGSVGKDGGKVKALNGKVQIDVPQGALQDGRTLVIDSLAQSAPADSSPASIKNTWLSFNVSMLAEVAIPNATPPGTPGEQDQKYQLEPTEAKFDELTRLTISFDGLINLGTLTAEYEPYVVTLDEASNIWVRVPLFALDRDVNTISVETEHFSTWGAGIGPGFPDNHANILLFDSAQPDIFTGRSHFAIPIWTPPGRNGLAPSLSLTYSSGSVDGILGDVQSPWTGMGWSLSSPEIARKITNGPCSPCGNGYYGYKNEFILLLDGKGYELLPEGLPGRFRTKDESFLYIQLHNVALNNSPSTNNVTGEWWEVVGRDGTRWKFGYDTDSEQLAAMVGYPGNATGAWASLGYAGKATDVVAGRWRADSVTDTHGNTVNFGYVEEPRLVTGGTVNASYDKATYLDEVSYNDGAYTVTLVREDRSGQDLPTAFNDWDNWDTKRLDKIEIRYNGLITRVYDLTYELRSYGDNGFSWTTTLLKSVDVSGKETGGTAYTYAPRVTFTYSDLENRASPSPKWGYPRLESIANGWGATASFTYSNDGRTDTTAWYNWRVDTLSIANGLGGVPMQTAFAYTDPCYNDEKDKGWCNTDKKGELVGYGQTTVTAKNFDGVPLTISVHKSLTEEAKAGREYETLSQDSTGNTLAKTVNTYDTFFVSVSGLARDGYFTYLKKAEQYILQGGSLVKLTKSEYQYEVDANNRPTGNLLWEKQYDSITDDVNPYRTTDYIYVIYTDTAAGWQIVKPQRQTVKDKNSVIISDQRYGYDGTAASIGAKGALTLKQVVSGGQSLDAVVVYDDDGASGYGNAIRSCAYTAYGVPGSMPTACGTTTTSAYLVTKTDYDTLLHTYPITITNALNQSVVNTYDYALGVPTTVTDPNSSLTTTKYDGLGRTLSIVYSGYAYPGYNPSGYGGASGANVKYTYPPMTAGGAVSAPFTVKMEAWDETASVYRSAWTIYDGLGRALQVQGPAETSGDLILTDTAYTALSQTLYSGQPRTVTGSGGTLFTPDWSAIPHTTTLYDALGRTTKVLFPDDTTAFTIYDGLRTTVVDQNGHQKTQETDALGRLKKVEEYNGAWPNATLYATTTYDYYPTDLLKTVTDNSSNVTTINYDGFGRKTDMTDPDMGNWLYQYDPLGNLVAQVDAKRQAIDFYYDALNRLKGKVYTTGPVTLPYTHPATDPGYAGYTVKYYFDDTAGGNKGIGHRTKMIDASGATCWEYNGLGQLTKETRRVDGTDCTTGGTAYVTLSGYDAFSRVLTQTIPSGETLNFTYNAMGAQSGLSGSQTYVSGIHYNASGQVTDQLLGNGVYSQYCYEPLTQRLAQFRAYPRPAPTATPESCTVANPANQRLNLTYQYDNGGNVKQMSDATRSEVTAYDYDELDRLKSAAASATLNDALVYQRSYTYDPLGNILTVGAWPGASGSAYLGRGSFAGGPAATLVPSYTPTASNTPTRTPTPTATATFTPGYTNTNTPIPTNTPTPVPSNTPLATATFTPPAGATTATLQNPTTIVLDTSFFSNGADTNYGTYTSLWIGAVGSGYTDMRRAIIKFDTSTIPSNATISSATLVLWMNGEVSSNNRKLKVYRLKKTWTETTATWRTRDGVVSWQAGGAGGVLDVENSDIGWRDFTPIEAVGAKHFQLDPSKVQGWVDGSFVNNGILIKSDTEKDDLYTFDSTNSATAANRPKLIVVYTTNPAIPTITKTFTPSNTSTKTHTPTYTATPNYTATFTPTTTSTATLPAGSTVITLQPDSSGVDSSLVLAAPATVYGADASLYVGENNLGTNSVDRGVLKFDLSSIPSGSTIVSATLSLWLTNDYATNSRTYRLYRLKRAWNESYATWNNFDAGVSWQTGGAGGLADAETVELGNKYLIGNEPTGEKQWALSPAKVQEWVNGSFANNGFLIKADGELDDLFAFASSDNATASQRPKLVIVYTGNTATPTPTKTNTPTNTPIGAATSTFTPTPTPTNTPTAAPGSVMRVFQPDGANGIDNTLLSPSITTNYGTANLYVGEHNALTNYYYRGLLQFDLSSIPPGSTILSATLSLWENTDFANNARTLRVYRMKRDWDEMSSTWNQFSSASGSTWQVPGAAGLNDGEASAIASRDFAANEPLGEKSWSLNPAKVQEWVNGSFLNNGLLIRADVETDDLFIFDSSDSANTLQRPKLAVVYAPPAPTPGVPYTYTSQRDGTKSNGDGDVMVINTAPSTNYSTTTYVGVGESNAATNTVYRSVLKFNLSAIPSNAVITSAALSLWAINDYASNARTFSLYRLKPAWTETGTTWNTTNGSTAWQVPGAVGTNDIESAPLASRAFSASESLGTSGEKQWVLDPAKVQEWVSGAFGNNGFLIKADTTELNDLYLFAGLESALTDQRPKLVINYTIPSTVTPTATVTNTPTGGTSATLQPDGAASNDVVIISSAPTTNYNSVALLDVGEYNGATGDVRRSLLKFDLSSIPSNAVLTSATLSLWETTDYANNARTFRVYRLRPAWTEGGATWNTTNGSTAWGTAGASSEGDAEATDVGSRAFSASEATGEKQWTLDPAKVQEMVNGSFTNNGFLIKADTETDDMYRFASGEDATASNRPKLVISYFTPTASPTPTLTPTPTATPLGYSVYSSQPDGTAGVDTMLYSYAATTNYGTSTNLFVGECNCAANAVSRSLLKFDLSSIPSSAIVTSATLSLWATGNYSSNDRVFNVHRLKQSWTEAGATWNKYDGTTNWGIAGASSGSDVEDTPIGSRYFLGSGVDGLGEKQWALNPAKVQEWVSGSFVNNGLVIKAQVELNDLYVFAPSDYGVTTQRPKLVISYYVPTNTPTPSNTPTNTPTATATPTATLPASDFIFADGFESGNLTGWSSSVTDSGDLSASTASKLVGSYGLQAVIDDTVSIYVQDNTPTAESHYRARFYFDPNGLTMADGDLFVLLSTNSVMLIEFRKNSGQYQMHGGIRDDASGWTWTAWVTLSDEAHYVEVDWQAATGAGTNNGSLAFYLDGALQDIKTGIDNDTRRVDTVQLGAFSGVDATTSGTLYFDAFESRRTSYIGPEYGAALPLYTGRGSVTAYIGGSASLPYSYGISTPYPTPTSQPGITTSTYSYAAQSGTCPDGALPAKPHAVTSVGSDTYCYDKNGNMVKRVEGGTTYTQVFDIENRLQSVTVGGVTTTFVYDGDGNLIKKVKGTTTTHYVGAYEVELNSGTATKKTTYYPSGGAMRVDIVGGTNTVYYMLKDHLGSASTLLDSSGNVVANGEQRYYPFGESRITSADLKTGHLFTGQLDMGLGGIYHFGARFYSSRLGRFLSADTIVPKPGNPQAVNRYGYAYNNSLKYVDPTGHEACYSTELEIGKDISQADCWAWGRDKFIRGLNINTPSPNQGYHPFGPNPGDVRVLVDLWLETLKTRGGELGAELASFFQDTDKLCQPLPGGGGGRCVSSPGHRITVTVANLGTGVGLQTDVNTNTIIIAPGIIDQASRSELDLLLTAGEFGHEIEHLRQGPFVHMSLHSERDAYEVQYQLYIAMGIDVSAPNAPSEVQAALIGHNLVGATDAQLINSQLGKAYPDAPLYKIIWWADPMLREHLNGK